MKPPPQYPTNPAAMRHPGALLLPQELSDEHAFLNEDSPAEAGVVR